MANLLSRLFNYPSAAKETPGERTYFWVPRFEAGKLVNHDTALSVAAVYAAVRVIAEGISTLPWLVLQPDGDNKRKRLTDHSVATLLNRRANTDMGAFSWRETALGHALLWGNHYSEIDRDSAGRPVGLWPLHPANVEVKRDDNGGLFYEVRQRGGGLVSIPPGDMFHLHGLGSDGLLGYSVVALAARSIGMSIASEEFGASFYGNGAQLGGIISQKDGAAVLDPEGVKNLMATFNRSHKGSANAHKVEYLDGGLSYQEIGVKPDDAQFLGSRQFSVSEIARWFRVPPHKLGDLEHATFSNIEHQSIEFVTDALLPWAIRLEQEANYKLFNARTSRGIYTKLELKGLLRGDLAARTDHYREMRNIGVYSVNDILELEDRNPIGAEGDKRIAPLNMTTLDKIGEEPEPLPAPVVPDTPENQDAEVVVALRCFDSHQHKHASLAATHYNRAEFFTWREMYLDRHLAKHMAPIRNRVDFDRMRHITKRRLLQIYEGSEPVSTLQQLAVDHD